MTSARTSLTTADLPIKHQTSPNSRRAGIGGVGGGTGLVAIAQTIGPHTTLGMTLLYIAPAASFAVGATLYYLEVQASRYLERRVINSARKTLERQLDSNRTSDSHKTRIRKMLEELEVSEASAELNRVQIIRVTPRR